MLFPVVLFNFSGYRRLLEIVAISLQYFMELLNLWCFHCQSNETLPSDGL